MSEGNRMSFMLMEKPFLLVGDLPATIQATTTVKIYAADRMKRVQRGALMSVNRHGAEGRMQEHCSGICQVLMICMKDTLTN